MQSFVQHGGSPRLHECKRVFRLLGLLLTAVLVISLVAPTVSYAHYDTAYWNEGVAAQSKAVWMRYLDDDLKLNQLSLPGTHDSMAHKSNLLGLDVTRTQTMDLWSQLTSGIRALDIRLYYEPNSQEFSIHHGPVHVGYDLDDVLTTVQNFLNQYPSETVVMRLKQEQSSASDTQMRQRFNIYYDRYRDLFYKGGSDNPTLGAMRGKCVILSDVLSLNSYGINYRDLNVQDSYHLNTNWDLYSKWLKVKNHINTTNNATNSDIYMNYLNGSGGSFPYFVASGHSAPATGAARLATGLTEPGFHNYYPDFPRGAWFGVFATIYFEGVNTLTADYLTRQNIDHCGIVMADFPGERLINAIINTNDFPVMIYSNGYYGGTAHGLAESTTNYWDWGSVGNDTISSVKVAPGYQVTFYYDCYQQGKSVTFTSDSTWVGDAHNDKFSSMVVTKIS